VIRVASERDAESIARVWIRSWRQAYTHVFPCGILDGLSLEERTRQTLDAITRADTEVFVSEVDGDIGGFASVGPSREAEGCGELYAIYVDEVHWGSGIAQALMSRAEDELRRRGFDEAVLSVLSNNPRARWFYERNGWVADTPFREVIRGHEVDVVRYRKELVA
jgi:GNAT superfamily N-acetyltransferase